MLSLPAQISVFAYTGPVDFRKQHDGLVALLRSKLKVDPLNGSLFVFFNRRRDRVKLSLCDRNRFWLFYKRLERETYEGLRRGRGAKLQLTRVTSPCCSMESRSDRRASAARADYSPTT